MLWLFHCKHAWKSPCTNTHLQVLNYDLWLTVLAGNFSFCTFLGHVILEGLWFNQVTTQLTGNLLKFTLGHMSLKIRLQFSIKIQQNKAYPIEVCSEIIKNSETSIYLRIQDIDVKTRLKYNSNYQWYSKSWCSRWQSLIVNAECGTYFILFEDSFPCAVRIDALSSHGSHFSSDCVVWEHLKVIQIFKKLSIEMYFK